MFEWNQTSSCSSLSPNKNEICFILLIFSITFTKEVDFNQASPYYEVAMEIEKGKEQVMVFIFGC